jgi:hypothetical protein
MTKSVAQLIGVAILLHSVLTGAGCATGKSTASLVDHGEPQDRFEGVQPTVFPLPSSFLAPVGQGNPALPPELDQPLPKPLPQAKIVIHKTARLLKLFSGTALVREYPVKIGINPEGDKERQGDGRTPEGSFYICVKNPQSSYHLSLGLNYPAIEDAERGLRNRLISRAEHDAIVRRVAAGAIPPWNTPLGGEIFIHGEAEIWDWTYGCVAMNNRDIEELFSVIPLGTEVEITK